MSQVAKLGSLADDCSRLSANLSSVVDQSRQILDSSFLSSQEHLSVHVSSMNYEACMDIAMAMGKYEEYVATMEEIVLVQEEEVEEMVDKWQQLDLVAKNIFKKV